MNEEELLKSLCASEVEQRIAVRTLLYTKGKEFKYRFKRKGVPEDDCEDLVQEVMLKIIKGAQQFTGTNTLSDNSAAVWMNRVANNCMNDFFRATNKTQKMQNTELKVRIGSIDDENWMKSVNNQQSVEEQINVKEQEAFQDQVNRNLEIALQECVKEGFENFEMDEPNRAKALTMQMDGENIESIGRRIGKTTRAATEYLSQCRKKLRPYIEHCNHIK